MSGDDNSARTLKGFTCGALDRCPLAIFIVIVKASWDPTWHENISLADVPACISVDERGFVADVLCAGSCVFHAPFCTPTNGTKAGLYKMFAVLTGRQSAGCCRTFRCVTYRVLKGI